MAYTEIEGDLFALDAPALGHGCNCQGAMGAGIAKEFKRRFPDMYAEYRLRCQTGRFQLGDVFVWTAPDLVVYNLATQPRPGPSADREAVRLSARAMLRDAEDRGLPTVGIPRIGAGLGGLRWSSVSAVLAEEARGSGVELVVVSLPDA